MLRRQEWINQSKPASDFRPYLKDVIWRCWQNRWDAVGANKLRALCIKVGSYSYQGLSRRWETALCRLRIGHTRFSHGFLMERTPPPICQDCRSPLTVRHVLVECPRFLPLRRRFLSEHWTDDGVYHLPSVLGEDACVMGGGTFLFLERAGILNFI